MKKKWGGLLIGFAVMCSTTVFGEELEQSVPPPPEPTEIFGMFYTATQYQSVSGDIDAWNLARFGLRLSKNFNVSYNQIMLHDYKTKKNLGLNFRLDDAFIRTKWNRIAGNDKVSLGLEQHYMIPVSESSRRRTLMTSIRNRLLLDIKFNPSFKLSFEESPVLLWHRENGIESASGGSANEIFRNWFVITPTFTFLENKFTLYLPVWLQNSRFRTFASDTAKSGAWKHSLFLWPELVYSFNSNFEIGLTAMTGSLINSDFSDLTLGDAFKNLLTAFEVMIYL